MIFVTDTIQVQYYENFDLENIITPVKPEVLEYYLKRTSYDQKETQFLIDGFTNGFDLGYRGPRQIRQDSRNLRFTIGDKLELWNKVMKEVKEKRYAGPFKEIPYDYYIQSPIGLVPKDGGKKTRLIFHLSHPRDSTKGISVNGGTPKELTKVAYKTFDDAVRLCIKAGQGCYLGKSDMTSAFRHLCMKKEFWKYLVMKAQSPIDNKWYFFIDKCMPFGASISCSHFQRFSDAIAHIVKTLAKTENINYLDDFFFVALLKAFCDGQLQLFMKICHDINFPVSLEKTFMGTTRLTFLGLIIDTIKMIVCVPMEKIEKAKNLIQYAVSKKKLRLKKLQQITGFLNFLCKAVIPGRAFTRRLYCIEENALAKNMKKYHHIDITKEMQMDLNLWLEFLDHPSIYARGFIDFREELTSKNVSFYTDASANPLLGCGGISGKDYFIQQWDEDFIKDNKPSINYLELYALTVGISAWLHKYRNSQITIFCDNMSVVQMVNNNASSCRNCMYLIRIIVLTTLTNNVKLTVKHVPGKLNKFADLLSRLEYKKFWQLAKDRKMGFRHPTKLPRQLATLSDIWS